MNTAALPAKPWRDDAATIGLVGLAHAISHFNQLLLPPLFPWLKDAFAVSYTELGMLLTVFFVTSCVVQTLSGFWVDRYGPRPILYAGLTLLGASALGFAASQSYMALMLCAVVAGCGNGVFHPVDYTLINRKIGKARLGHAYSVHGITGSLGWALAPAVLVPITLASSWRVALVCASFMAFAVLALLVLKRSRLTLPAAAAVLAPAESTTRTGLVTPGSYDFLHIPAVWMCFAFFFFYAGALSIIQAFAPEAARQLHAVPNHWVAVCLSVYMVCSACGAVAGGFLATDPARCERVIAAALVVAAGVALAVGYLSLPALAVPLLFGAMGLASGMSGPSRDLLVKQSTPDNSTGRVYGVVYSGLDIGQALTPLVIGGLMDRQAWSSVWLALSCLYLVLIANAFNVRKVRRTALVPV